jgi:adenylate kinase family enzyme
VPVLGPDDPLPTVPSRVLVAGTSGAGKTTLSSAVARVTGLPHTDIDGLFHGPGWTVRPTFAQEAHALARGERWVTEWQYSAVRPLLLDRCDLLVWLDLPVTVVMSRLVRRTVSRRLRRTELWNGNRESPLWRILVDRDHIVRWGWRTRRRTSEHVHHALARRPELPVVRLRSTREVRRWLDRGPDWCGQVAGRQRPR